MAQNTTDIGTRAPQVSTYTIDAVDTLLNAKATTAALAAAVVTQVTNALDTTTIATEADILTKHYQITTSNLLNANLIHDGTVSDTDYACLADVAGNIQTQLGTKQFLITGSNRLGAGQIHDGTVSTQHMATWLACRATSRAN